MDEVPEPYSLNADSSRAVGDRIPSGITDSRAQLTAREAQIAQLAPSYVGVSLERET
jgi:hypothetical protein